VSIDGGLSWSPRTFIPQISALSGGTAAGAGDPIAGIDASGNLFVATLSAGGSPLQSFELYLSKSADAAHTLGPPVTVFTSDARYEADKDGMAINTFPGSPTFNRIALAFTVIDKEFQPNPGQKGQIVCTYSDDAGATWSPPTPVSLPGATYAQPFFFRDGSLAILYEWVSTNAVPKIWVECVLSPDGGRTFGNPTLAMDETGLNYKPPFVSAYSDTSVCSDRQAGVLYITAAALHVESNKRLPRVLFTKSIDRGQTWTTPIPVNDTPGGGPVFQPTIAASPDGQHITIGFYDKRNSQGHTYLVDYYLAESFDGGDTWEPNLRLSEFTTDLRNAPDVGDGVTVGDYQGFVPALNFDTPAVATWIDTRSGNNDPYAVRITRTKGTTFKTWRRLRFSTNDLANPNISGEQADPDGDGIPNLAEYAFGLEPGHPDPRPVRALVTDSSVSGGPAIAIEYERLAVLSDIRLTWETSTNLKDWTPAPALGLGGSSLGRDASMTRIRELIKLDGRRAFFRLRVERTL
jgi:hypothetical protein